MTWDQPDANPAADIQAAIEHLFSAPAQPTMLVVSPAIYARVEWEFRKTRIVHDVAAHLFPRWTRARRWARRKVMEVRWRLEERRHPGWYA